MTVGTSALVYPAAGLLSEARRKGAFTAEINLEATPASEMVDLSLQGPAEVILQKLEDILAAC
jgi:NAD-dependent deacetylase